MTLKYCHINTYNRHTTKRNKASKCTSWQAVTHKRTKQHSTKWFKPYIPSFIDNPTSENNPQSLIRHKQTPFHFHGMAFEKNRTAEEKINRRLKHYKSAIDFSVFGSLDTQRLSKQYFCFYLMTNFRMVEPRSVRTLMKYTPAER